MLAESVATQSASSVSALNADASARRQAAKDHLKRLGMTVRAWAERHGYAPKTAYKVLSGDLHGHYGISHNIAVRLGMKDGDIDPTFEPAVTAEAVHG